MLPVSPLLEPPWALYIEEEGVAISPKLLVRTKFTIRHSNLYMAGPSLLGWAISPSCHPHLNTLQQLETSETKGGVTCGALFPQQESGLKLGTQALSQERSQANQLPCRTLLKQLVLSTCQANEVPVG